MPLSGNSGTLLRLLQTILQTAVFRLGKNPIDRIILERVTLGWGQSDIAGDRLFSHGADFLYGQGGSALFFGLPLQGLQLLLLFLNGSLCGVQRLLCLSDLSGHIFQPLLLLCHLELGHSQMFFSAATLHIGISGSFHIVEEIVLQDTVRCPQDFLALGGQNRIALLIQSNF